jgi:hypothetical protein
VRAAYLGHEALTFTDYLDLETGKTLYAEPGEVYDIAPASGRLVDEIPEPWFAAAPQSKAAAKRAATAAADAAALADDVTAPEEG